MANDAPITLAAMQAVCAPPPACTLRPPVRHLVCVMALLANHRTGVGYAGQGRLAGALGYGDRMVRVLLAELDSAVAAGASPVAVERHKRFRQEGRGRTSDEYRLVVFNRNPGSACTGATTGTTVPHEPDVQPEQIARSTGTDRHVQPEPPFRGSDPRRDPHRDPHSVGATSAPPKQAARRVKRAQPIPASWAPTAEHAAFAARHGLDLELEATGFRGHFDGQAVKSPNGRFATWLANAVKFGRERAARGNGRHADDGRLDAYERDLERATQERAERGGQCLPRWIDRMYPDREKLDAALFARQRRNGQHDAPGALDHESRRRVDLALADARRELGSGPAPIGDVLSTVTGGMR